MRAALRDLAREHDELVNSVHRDEMARTQQRMRIEQLAERALEELGLDEDALVADYGPDQLVPFSGELADGETAARPGAVRPRGADQAAARGRALARHARQGQPAGAGGVLRAGGAPQVPHRAARGPQGHPQGPPRHRPRGRRPRAAGLHRGVRRRGGRLRRRRSPGCSPAARAGWCSPTRPTCSPPASRSRPGRRARRSSGCRCCPAASGRWWRWRSWWRCSRPGPSPFYILDEVEAALDDTNLGRLLQIYEELRDPQPAARDHPPEAHDGGRRRPLRRDHARRRRLDGDQPAAPRAGLMSGAGPAAAAHPRRLRALVDRDDPLGRHGRLRPHEQRPLLRADRHRHRPAPAGGDRGSGRHARPIGRVRRDRRAATSRRSATPPRSTSGSSSTTSVGSSIIYRVGLLPG